MNNPTDSMHKYLQNQSLVLLLSPRVGSNIAVIFLLILPIIYKLAGTYYVEYKKDLLID